MHKRVMALLLSLVLLVSAIMPTTAMAAEDEGGAAPAPSGAVTPVPGAPQSASTQTEERSGVWTALAWIVGIAVLGGLAFAVVSGGGFSGLSDRVKRFSSEVSGGLFGKKPKE